MTGQSRAVLFDVDGTLVDSNYLHVSAWAQALDEVGFTTPSWRIHRAIGLDGDLLVDQLQPDMPDDIRERASNLHSELYRPLMSRMRPLPGARALVQECHRRGWTVVLATSAPDEEVEAQRSCLEVEDWIAGATSADDVETAKPRPDIIRSAFDLAGATAGDAVLVGDSVWDVAAGLNAGVPVVGLLSGGVSEAELREAGAVQVYAGAANLLDRLDSSPLAKRTDTSP